MRWISDTGASWHSAEGKLEFPLKVCLQFKALSGVRIRLCLLDCAVICYLLFRSLLNLDTVRISNVQCVIKPGHWTQASASTCFVVNIQSWTHSGLQKSNVDFEMFQKNSWTIKVFCTAKWVLASIFYITVRRKYSVIRPVLIFKINLGKFSLSMKLSI